jgi:predicted acyl esterase
MVMKNSLPSSGSLEIALARASKRTATHSTIVLSIAAAIGLSSASAASDRRSTSVEPDAAANAQAAAFMRYSRPDSYGTAIQADLLVPTRDGYRLTCDLYRPAAADGSPSPGRFPSLLTSFTSYGRKSPELGNDLRDFSKKGYAVLWCQTRGSQGLGKSSPSRPESVTQVNPFSPQDVEDNYDVIEWLAKQPWSTGHVGQIGTSYGGITTWRTAGLTPSHLKAIIPVLAPHDLYRYFFTEGGIRTAVTNSRGAWPTGCSGNTGEDTCSSRLPAEWNSHPNFDEYWKARTVELDAIKVPTLIVSGARDHYMGAHEARWPVMAKRDNVATVIGPWPHLIVETLSPEMKNAYLAWFDRWVANIPNAPMPPKAVVQGIQSAGTGKWEGFTSWPPRASEERVFYLTPSGLKKGSPGKGNLKFVIAADGTSAGLALSSEPFAAASTLAGPVQVKLPLSFSATDANLIVNIQSQSADGAIKDMGYSTYKKASHLESDASPSPRVPGDTYQFTMNVPSRYWTFNAGDRMVLTITSADKVVVSDSPPGTVTVSLGAEALVRAPFLPR